jgi:hypothetical protein
LLGRRGIQSVKSLFLYLSSIEAESPFLISQFYRSIHFLSSASVVTTTSHQSINQLRNIYLPTRFLSRSSRSQATIKLSFRTTLLSDSVVRSTRSFPSHDLQSTQHGHPFYPFRSIFNLVVNSTVGNQFRPSFQRYLSASPLLRVSNPIFGLPFYSTPRYHQRSRVSSTIGAGRVSWWTRPYTRITATLDRGYFRITNYHVTSSITRRVISPIKSSKYLSFPFESSSRSWFNSKGLFE